MNMKKYFILAAAAIMISACSFDHELEYGVDTPQTPEGRLPLAIGVNNNTVGFNNVTTRSTYQAVQKDTISSKAELGLFVLTGGQTKVNQGTSAPEPYDYEFFNIKADATPDPTNARTDLAANDNTNNVLVFPSNKSQNIDLYAYAPYNSSTTITDIDASTTTTNTISVSVQADQSTDLGYIKSDVLWGCVGADSKGKSTYTGLTSFTGKPGATINGIQYLSAKTTSVDGFVCGTTADPLNNPKVIIPMLHRASKIVVKLKVSGMPISKLEEALVRIKAIKDGELRIDNGNLTASTSASTTDILMTDKLGYKKTYASTGMTETKLTISDSDTDGTNGVIAEDTDNDPSTSNVITTYLCSAIVIPQNLTASANLIEIKLRDGDGSETTDAYYKTTYKYNNPATPSPTAFESGKVYTYTITVKASGLDVTTTVHDWETPTTNPAPGNAELE